MFLFMAAYLLSDTDFINSSRGLDGLFLAQFLCFWALMDHKDTEEWVVLRISKREWLWVLQVH